MCSGFVLNCPDALDQAHDPQNVGALLRTALFLGVDGVIWSKTCASLSATVSKWATKASAGAMEHAQVIEAPHLLSFLQMSKDQGWHIMGTALGPNVVPVQNIELQQPTILILGEFLAAKFFSYDAVHFLQVTKVMD